MKRPLLLVAASILVCSGAAAQDSIPRRGPAVEMKQSGTPGKAIATRTMKVTASVYAIDAERRIVTLQNEMGGTETFKVGPDVRRLDQIAPGDTVVLEYVQGLALELQPEGSDFVPPTDVPTGAPADGDQSQVAASALGVRSTVTITKVNVAKRLVTMRTPGGNVFRVKAGPGIQIEKLKVGDRLVATYQETVAVNLKKAPAR
jgi:hypothetical protein